MTTPEPINDPFALDRLDEIPLTQTPLVVALCQFRFPSAVSSIDTALKDGTLVRALTSDYPYAQSQPVFQLIVQPGQPTVPQPAGSYTWVLSDPSQKWTVNLSGDSIGVTTTQYKSRDEFITRVTRLVDVVHEVADPPAISRAGVRYINRISDPTLLQSWPSKLITEVGGILNTLPPAIRGGVLQATNDFVYQWPASSYKLQARWGQLLPNFVPDAAVIPIPVASWFMDIDAFEEAPSRFLVSDLAKTVDELAARAYRVFRWAVTPDGLEALGAH